MNPRMRNGNPPSSVYGRHEGETIIVIGNSSSLLENDMDEFDGYTTIGVNRILQTYEPTYLFVVDRSVMESEHARMMESPSIKLIYPGAMSSRYRKLYTKAWTSLPHMDQRSATTAKTGNIHIPDGGNSGYEAIQMAYRMGASRIALAGIDMYWPPRKHSHFFGDGHAAGCRMPLVEKKIEAFKSLKQDYIDVGVELFSISPWKTEFRDKMGYVPQADL